MGLIFVPTGALTKGTNPTVLIVAGMLSALAPVMLLMLRRGYVESVSLLLVSLTFVAAIVYVSSVGSIRHPIASSFIICVVIAGLLIGYRGTVVVTVLSLVALLGLWWAETVGLLPPYIYGTAGFPWSAHAPILILTAVLLTLATRGLNDALERARRNERALAETNEGLQREITERKRSERVQAAIYRISEAAQTAQDLSELLGSIHAIVGELMPARNFYIALYDVFADVFVTTYLVDEFGTPTLPYEPGKGLTAYVFRTGEPLLVTPGTFDRLVQSGQVELIGKPTVDWLGVPLKAQYGPIGVMAVYTYTDATRLEEADKDILAFVSTQVAMAIERKRAGEALRESESRYRGLFENVPISFWEEDFSAVKAYVDELRAKGTADFRAYFENQPEAIAHCVTLAKILDVNRATLELYQAKSKKELLGSLDRVLGPEAYDVFKEELLALAEGESPFSTETINSTLTGDKIHVNLSLSVAPGEEDTWSRVLVSITDVTERKRAEEALQKAYAEVEKQVEERTAELQREIAERKEAEEALRASEERFALAVQGSNEGIWERDIAHNTLYWSPRLKELLGYAEDELDVEFDTFEAFLHPDDRERIRAAIEAHLKDREPYDVEERLCTKSGEYRWFSAKGQALWDKAGNPIRMAGSISDITERKEAEEALRVSEERFALAVRGSNDGIWDWDIAHNTLYWSPRLKELLGYADDELDVKFDMFEAFLHPDDRGRIGAALEAHLKDRGPYDVEYRPRLKSGEHRWFRARGQALWDETGKPLRMAGSVTDITELKQGQEALWKAYEEVEKQVQERTAELRREVAERKRAEEETRKLNEELEQRVVERTAQLEAANKELEAFSYSVSHDLRAPLRHTAGFVRLLLEREAGRLDATSGRYLDIIAQSSHKMDRLIDDLLALSRAGRVELQIQRVELDGLVREAQQELATEMEGRHITWEIGPLPAIKGDPALLRQVWVNLLSNAIKFTAPRPEARIEIGVKRGDTDDAGQKGEAIIFVRDNGVGFDPQYAPRLFGVFQRLHREEDFEGTGIGLAIVRRIIHRHGGQVWAEGETDHGATFYFTLREAKGE